MQKSDLEIGDYVEYRYRDWKLHKYCKGEGYILAFAKTQLDEDLAWTGKEKGVMNKGMDCIATRDILRKVPPPEGAKIQREVTRP